MQESPVTADESQRARALVFRRAIRKVARSLPFEPGCLAMGIVAMAMLRVRRQSSTLYFGLAKEDGEELAAHAWLRTGDVIVTGGTRRSEGYVVVGQFMMSGAGKRSS